MRKESHRMTQRRPGLTRQFLASLTAPVIAAVAALGLAADASAQLRVVNYNGAKFIGNSSAIRAVLAETAFDDKPGFAVAPAIIASMSRKTYAGPEPEVAVTASCSSSGTRTTGPTADSRLST